MDDKYLTYADGDEKFAAWLRHLDQQAARAGVVSILEMDIPWRAAYDNSEIADFKALREAIETGLLE